MGPETPVGPEHSRAGSQLAAWPFAEPWQFAVAVAVAELIAVAVAALIAGVVDSSVLADGREG